MLHHNKLSMLYLLDINNKPGATDQSSQNDLLKVILSFTRPQSIRNLNSLLHLVQQD